MAALSAALLAAVPGSAQTVATGGAPASEADSAGVAEIIVTARRRAENLQDTPVAVTALTGDQIVTRNISTIDELVAYAPNVYTASGGAFGAGTALFSIRGQVQGETLITVDPSVGVYIDSIYIARNNGILTDLVDLSRAEVLKGPQGTLYGRNTTGGAVALYTNDPTYKFETSISGRYSRFNQVGVEGLINVPIVADKVALRFAGSFTGDGGVGRNIVSDAVLERELYRSARLKLLIEPAEQLRLILAGDYNFVSARGAVSKLAYLAEPGGTAFEGALLETAFEEGLFDPDTFEPDLAAAFQRLSAFFPGNRRQGATNAIDPISGLQADNARHKNWGVAGTVELELGPVTLKSITAYRELISRSFVDGDATPFSILDVYSRIDPTQFTQELQLSGKALDSRLNYILGGFYFFEKGTDVTTSNQLAALAAVIPQIVNPLTNQGTVRNRSRAAFAQVDFDITDTLSTTAGLRYTRDTKSLAQFQQNGPDCGIPPELRTPPTECLFDRSRTYGGWSYTFGLDWKPIETALLYAKTSRGFRSGGQNLRARGDALLIAPSFEPETATDYEIGIKSDWLDRRLRVNGALFYTDYANIQKQTNRFADGVTTSIINNAAQARVWGAELEVTAVPVTGLTLGASAGYTNAKYLEFEDDAGDRAGEPFAFVPEWTYVLSADYDREIGPGTGFAHIDWVWTDAIDFGLGGPGSREPSFGLLNGRIGFRSRDDRWELAIFGKNILDKEYFESRLDFSNDLGYAAGFYGSPRVFGIEATIRFGGR